MIDNDLLYGLGGPRPKLVLRKNVLRRFEQHRQLSACSMEAGGQLFARFAINAIMIEKATGPYRSDQRSRSWFVPDREREQRDIGQAFRNGLHFIGNWHTHPQELPSPSTVDIKNTAERFRLSKHTLTLKTGMEGVETAQATQHQNNPIAPRWTFRVRTH